MASYLGEEDLTVWETVLVESEQPVNRPGTQVALVGKLPSPRSERLVKVNERIVQVEEGKPLHSGPSYADRFSASCGLKVGRGSSIDV